MFLYPGSAFPNITRTPRRGGWRQNGAVDQGKGLVLVVEDERPIADLLRMYLAREGFGVHVEHDGTAGLVAARKLRPVACVLDIALPGMDGTEICRRLRESGDWTPVLFLTARDDEVDRILGLELGGDDYITKPFSPVSWCRGSRRCCGARRGRRTSSRSAPSGRSRSIRPGGSAGWTAYRWR